jgi:hypothetical protein
VKKIELSSLLCWFLYKDSSKKIAFFKVSTNLYKFWKFVRISKNLFKDLKPENLNQPIKSRNIGVSPRRTHWIRHAMPIPWAEAPLAAPKLNWPGQPCRHARPRNIQLLARGGSCGTQWRELAGHGPDRFLDAVRCRTKRVTQGVLHVEQWDLAVVLGRRRRRGLVQPIPRAPWGSYSARS